MSDTAAGAPPTRTSDFIPGWYRRIGTDRKGEQIREAVRTAAIAEADFPLYFLRADEFVRPARPPQRGVTIAFEDRGVSLAVPLGYWIVRDSDGELRNWSHDEFTCQWVRDNEREWVAPAERDETGREAMARAIKEALTGGERPAWAGEPPAKGTRRALIRDAIYRELEDYFGPKGALVSREFFALKLADAIEADLLKIDIGADPTGEVSPASTAMDVLDQLEIPRTREGAILDIGQRVTELADKFTQGRRDAAECYRLTGADPSDGSDAMLAREAVDEVRRFRAEYDELEEAIAKVGDALDRIDAPQGATYAERIDRLYREMRDRIEQVQRTVDRVRAEGKVKAGTRELVIVLEDVSDADQPPEYRFIELEDQDGAGVGSFPMRPSIRKPFLEITIPYGRDDAWVSEVAYQAAGAATRPLLEDHPDYVFPSERVSDAVAELLSDFGIPRACRDCAGEQLEHGAKEVDGRRDDTIKGLSERCDQLLEQRESARVGEDQFKAQRDAALYLLRWLIGDLIPNGGERMGEILLDGIMEQKVGESPLEDRREAQATAERDQRVDAEDDRPLWRVEVDYAANHVRNAIASWLGL